MCAIPLGSRVICDGDYGTVLYVGEVIATSGIWYGVEWDNPLRGKHNGSYNGVKYFETSHPTSGSFVRPTKVKLAKSCSDAVIERYCDDDNVIDENTMCLPQKYGKKRNIEFVGLDKIINKQSQLNHLREVDLSAMCINEAGPLNALFSLIPNITNMILSNNMLTSWNLVADIVKQLPHLKMLNISENKIPVPENPEEFKSAFGKLETLILNKMSYDWSQIMACAVMWPDIKYLDLWCNRITILTEIPSDTFSNIQFLNISDNPIDSWEEICKLGMLPRLEKLILENANISNIFLPMNESSNVTDLFPNLKSLYLTNNKLSQWKDVAEMHKFQHLEDLKLKGNPVMLLEAIETSCQYVIAKLSLLKRLNGQVITREERRGAELDYLKKYCEYWLKSGGNRIPELNQPDSEFLSEHPTYLNLIKEYGAPEDSELKKQSTLLKNNLISVELCCLKNSNKKSIKKKLPGTMTVGKLKTLINRLFNLNTYDISLWIISAKEIEPEIEMDNDLREISFFSIRNDDKICIR